MTCEIDIAISNIAWDPTLDEAVIELLQESEISKIEVAPKACFDDIDNITTLDIEKYHQKWSKRGIQTIAMQALLFGTTGFNVFSSESDQDDMLNYLDKIAILAQNLGASRLVFGSPKNRLLNGLDIHKAENAYFRFFSKLGDIGAKRNCVFCLEPNPVRYGADFMTDTASTAKVVRDLNHPQINLQFDSGAMIINDENLNKTISDNFSIYGHYHLSLPDLAPIRKTSKLAQLARIFLNEKRPVSFSIEMKKVELSYQIQQLYNSINAAKTLFKQ